MLNFVLVAAFWEALLGVMLFGTAIFLILVVLVQRGRGGGLAGALGGMGGQSAFGAKAGDLFTRITMVVAFLWIVLCLVSVKTFNASSKDSELDELGTNAPAEKTGQSATPERKTPE